MKTDTGEQKLFQLVMARGCSHIPLHILVLSKLNKKRANVGKKLFKAFPFAINIALMFPTSLLSFFFFFDGIDSSRIFISTRAGNFFINLKEGWKGLQERISLRLGTTKSAFISLFFFYFQVKPMNHFIFYIQVTSESR